LRAVPSSEAFTRGVRVVVNARYSSSHSDPAKREWFFLYTVTITNEGEDTVQLVNRHWVIMNANGHVEEVRGPGVVGNQPTLKTGESFEYTSGCPLKTPFGSMHGSYEMVTEDGEAFLAEIAPFALRESETSIERPGVGLSRGPAGPRHPPRKPDRSIQRLLRATAPAPKRLRPRQKDGGPTRVTGHAICLSGSPGRRL
jgi:ApaG protein